MIGSLKPSEKQHFKTICIGKDIATIYYHYLNIKGSFIESFKIDDITYYHVFERYLIRSEESETPIYNQVIEMEIINLYEMYKLITQNKGEVLDLNTDCCVCTFENDLLPFNLD